MRHAHDLAGKKFGRLVVLERDVSEEYDKPRWSCVCACGNLTSCRASLLKNGGVTSCGCYARELTSKRSTAHGMSGSPTYVCWRSMVTRCENPDNRWYFRRGIVVCDRWKLSFVAFLGDVGKRPSKDHSLDRIDNARGYEPGNVRWATRAEQQANKTNSKGLAHSKIMKKVVARGSAHPGAKLDECTVSKIKKLKKRGVSYDNLAEKFGVTKQAIASIIKGRSWTHVK